MKATMLIINQCRTLDNVVMLVTKRTEGTNLNKQKMQEGFMRGARVIMNAVRHQNTNPGWLSMQKQKSVLGIALWLSR